MNDDYFQAMYAADPDPWGFGSRWYEQRKYALTLGALPRAMYRRTFEPGCSIGVLSEQLAARTDRLLAVDLVPAAVSQAAARLDASDTATAESVVRQWDMHKPWPEETFDLVVVSEVLYYLEAEQARGFVADAREHLDPDGHLVLVHWRHEVPEYPLSGDEAHRIALSTPGLATMAHYEDVDLVLDVLTTGDRLSVAAEEGLR